MCVMVRLPAIVVPGGAVNVADMFPCVTVIVPFGPIVIPLC
jgi:hypothetical protein